MARHTLCKLAELLIVVRPSSCNSQHRHLKRISCSLCKAEDQTLAFLRAERIEHSRSRPSTRLLASRFACRVFCPQRLTDERSSVSMLEVCWNTFLKMEHTTFGVKCGTLLFAIVLPFVLPPIASAGGTKVSRRFR